MHQRLKNVTSFLDELADELLAHHRDTFENTIVVLPARRASLFLKRALSTRSQHSGWIPELLTMSELTERMAGMARAEGIDLLFDLFTVWREHHDREASFESFLQWGPTALSDFNEIDHHRCDAKSVFKNLHEFKEIELWSFKLGEAEWSEDQQRFARFWLQLGTLYDQFQERMRENNGWYGGAIARRVSDDPLAGFERLQTKHIIFAGLNALTGAEHQIINTLVSAGKATFRWDADRYYVNDKKSEAGLFVRKFQNIDAQPLANHFSTRQKSITFAACSGTITQVHYAAQVLRGVSEKEATNTAIILPDNSVLPILTHALPEHFSEVNVTMGRPLTHTGYHSLVSCFFTLLDSRSNRLRFNALLPFCRHPFTTGAQNNNGRTMKRVATGIVKNNLVFADREAILSFANPALPGGTETAELFDALFTAIARRTPDNIIGALRQLQTFIEPPHNADPERLQGWKLFCGLTARIERLCSNQPVISDLREFQRIYLRLFSQLQIDLVGKPLTGLQIMGLLESRALDFKRVIILNANENKLPRHQIADTFLPPDLRHFLQLPSARERDAYYGYYFYRLLQRADEIHIAYTSGGSGNDEGERSRYIQQLLTCPLLATMPITLNQVNVMAEAPSLTPAIQPIATGQFTADRIADQLKRGLSPSAFNLWLQNPREFFFKYILGLGEQDEVEDEMESRTLGTLVHEVVEEVFKAFLNVTLDPEALKATKKSLEPLLNQALEKNYNLALTRYGVNYLLKKVALSFAEKIIQVSVQEATQAEVVVTELEKKLEQPLTDNITLRGTADRIDRINKKMRIIDYKTGSVSTKDLTLPDDWAVKLAEGGMPKLLQCLVYAYIAAQQSSNNPPVAGIISSRNHRSGFMSVRRKNAELEMDGSFAIEFGHWMCDTIHTLQNDLTLIHYDSGVQYPTYTRGLGG